MDKSDFENWLKKHFMAWSELNSRWATLLFSKDCRYYESVFEEPCKSWDNILKLWLAIQKNQKDITYLACCLATKSEGIWTNDLHFLQQNKIRIFTNKDMLDTAGQ